MPMLKHITKYAASAETEKRFSSVLADGGVLRCFERDCRTIQAEPV
jgi:hypothetical protein